MKKIAEETKSKSKTTQASRKNTALFVDELIDGISSLAAKLIKSLARTHCLAPAEMDDGDLPYGHPANPPVASIKPTVDSAAHNVVEADVKGLVQDHISFSPVSSEDEMTVLSSDEAASDMTLISPIIKDGGSL